MKIFVGSVLLLLAANVQAIVNIESIKANKDKPGFYSQLGMNAAGASGNTEKLAFGVNTRLDWKAATRSDFVVAEYEYGESRGEKDAEKAFIHIRHIKNFRKAWDWEAFAQASTNEFARLNFRGLTGGGLRLAMGEKSKFYLGLGGFYEHESIQEETGTNDDLTNQTWRLNSYFVYKDSFNDYVKSSNVLYLQPALDDVGDLRVLGQFALLVKAGSSVSIKMSVNVSHDQNPPQSVDKTDWQYATGIVFEF